MDLALFVLAAYDDMEEVRAFTPAKAARGPVAVATDTVNCAP